MFWSARRTGANAELVRCRDRRVKKSGPREHTLKIGTDWPLMAIYHPLNVFASASWLSSALAGLRASATLQPEAQRTSIPRRCLANCHRWAKVNCHSRAKISCQTQLSVSVHRLLRRVVVLFNLWTANDRDALVRQQELGPSVLVRYGLLYA